MLVVPTVTDGGTVSVDMLLDSVTVAPPVSVVVTVHVELPPVPSDDVLHVTPFTRFAVPSKIVAVCVLPLRVAVMVAVWLLVIVPAVAAKVAVVLPAPTVTVAGTVSAATLLDKATVAPLVSVTVTVQVEVSPEPRLDGMQATPLSNIGPTSEIVAVCVLPFSFAVIVAVWLLVIVPAVAVKVAVVLVVPTVTVAGTVKAVTLLDTVTAAPPVCETVSVHVEAPPLNSDVGLHVTPLTTVATNAIVAVSVLPFSVAVMVAV